MPDWRLWHLSCLRSAGFPAETVTRLARPECAAVADRLHHLEAEFADRIADALAAVRTVLGVRRAEGHLDRGSPLLKALHAIKAGRVPAAPQVGDDGADTALTALRAVGARVRQAGRDYEAAFADATRETSRVILELAHDPTFSEAVIWQNRHAYHTAILRLRASGSDVGRNSGRRQYEHLVARSLQRYAVKNDTIGFFGPVGWATFSGDAAPLAARHGPTLVRQRTVHLEQWGVDAVADVLGAQPGIEPWLSPRRLPFAHLDGTTAFPIDGPPLPLSPGSAAALAACTGRHQACEIAADLVASGIPGVDTVEDVYAILGDLRSRGLVTWALEVPFVTDADRALSVTLSRIGDTRLRETSQRALRVLQAARDAVARSAGDADALDRSVGQLEAVFERLTGHPATRSHGNMYAARTLVYEDCVRDLDIEIGAPLLRELARPLSLVLRSARWATSEAARRYGAALRQLFRELAGGAGTVPASAIWQRAPELFPVLGEDYRKPDPIIDRLGRDLQQRWVRLLGLRDLHQHVVRYSSAMLEPEMSNQFPAGEPGYGLALYHSPDIMIAARDADAIARGDYQFVMGEVHISTNTLGAALFVDAHPDPEKLLGYADVDLATPCVISLPPRRWHSLTSRTRNALSPRRATYFLMSHEFVPDVAVPTLADAERVTLAELVVEEVAGRLVARTLDGRFACEILEMFGELISLGVANVSRIFATTPHVPRITVDRLVVQRETWRFPVADLRFTYATNEAERYREARRWAASHELPRRMFYTVPVEEKPIFVDFESPILVDIFAKCVRHSGLMAPDAQVSLSEMLPDIQHAWLTDAAGRHYTSELRIVAVDMRHDTAQDEPERAVAAIAGNA